MFILTSDSAVDLFRPDAEKLDVEIVPLTYTIGDVTVEDFAEDESEFKKFYDGLKGGSLPVTSQINPFTHCEFWEKVYAKRGAHDIVHLTLSSGLSKTYDSACQAADEFMTKHLDVHVYVVDSLGATQAETPILEKAIALRDSGANAADAAEELRNYAHRIHAYIIVDNLFHLKRGGRIGAAAAFIGTALGIKPIIIFNDKGQLCVYKKPLGWKKALKIVLDHIEQYCAESGKGKIWIAQADAKEKAEEAKAAIEKRFGSTVQIGWIGPVIGSHINSGTIGIVFDGGSRIDLDF